MSMRFLPLIMAIRSWLVNVKAAKAAAVHLFPMTQKLRLSCSSEHNRSLDICKAKKKITKVKFRRGVLKIVGVLSNGFLIEIQDDQKRALTVVSDILG